MFNIDIVAETIKMIEESEKLYMFFKIFAPLSIIFFIVQLELLIFKVTKMRKIKIPLSVLIVMFAVASACFLCFMNTYYPRMEKLNDEYEQIMNNYIDYEIIGKAVDVKQYRDMCGYYLEKDCDEEAIALYEMTEREFVANYKSYTIAINNLKGTYKYDQYRDLKDETDERIMQLIGDDEIDKRFRISKAEKPLQQISYYGATN